MNASAIAVWRALLYWMFNAGTAGAPKMLGSAMRLKNRSAITENP